MTNMRLLVKLIVSFLFLLLISFAVMSDWLRREVRLSYGALLEESLIETAQLVSAQIASQIIRDREENGKTIINVSYVKSAIEQYKLAPIFSNVRGNIIKHASLNLYVTDDKGIVLYHSAEPFRKGEDFSKWNDVYRTLRGEYGARSTRLDKDNPLTSVFYIAAPIKVHGELMGVVSVFRKEQTIESIVQSSFAKMGVIILAVVLLLTVLSLLVFWWIITPFEKLKRYVLAVQERRSAKLPKLPAGEFTSLGNAIEEMRNTIDDREKMERYVQNLTHELKSPITAIQAAAEICESEGKEIEAVRKFSGNIIQESQRMTNLLNSMLEIASLDSPDRFEFNDTVSPFRLFYALKESLKPILTQKRIELSIDCAEDVEFIGNEFLIQQAIRNILHNAISASPEGSTIYCYGKSTDGGVQIQIRDEGPGLPDYALTKVFDRFFSIPHPGSKHKGSGLGLTFTKEVIDLHKGKIHLENNQPGLKISININSL